MKNNAKQCVDVLLYLVKEHPSTLLSEHIEIATSECSLSCLSDGEFLHCLEKYKMEKELDFIVPLPYDEEYYEEEDEDIY